MVYYNDYNFQIHDITDRLLRRVADPGGLPPAARVAVVEVLIIMIIIIIMITIPNISKWLNF